jgi:two-component system OmpR family response regulator
MRNAIRRTGSDADSSTAHFWNNVERQLGPLDTMAARLSPTELALLHALLARPGAIFSSDELKRQIGGNERMADDYVIEIHIDSLNSKLGSEAIKTIRGLGWMVSSEI